MNREITVLAALLSALALFLPERTAGVALGDLDGDEDLDRAPA